MSESATRPPAAIVWHDCECGGYAADLELWRELAARAGQPALDLGAGTGRVSIDLARAGFSVAAVDRDRDLLAALSQRAAAAGVEVATVLADVRALRLGERYRLIIAPMQLAQLLGGAEGRAAMLRAAAAHLAPGGIFAAALLADEQGAASSSSTEADERPPLPDVVERGGWVYSSLPLEVRRCGETIEVRRLRQVVAPSGELTDEVDTIRLDRVSADRFEIEARAAGLRPVARREISPTAEHVGSTVVVCEGA